LTALIVALAVLVPITFVAQQAAPRWISGPLGWVVFTWLGFALYLLVFAALSDAGVGVAALARALPQDPDRRLVLSRAISATIAGAAGLVGLGGIANASGFDIRRVRVPLARLPKAASGYSIVQLTDVHVGPTIGREFIERVVAETNALAPDMIVITGDLVDGTVDHLREHVAPLRGLKARDGVFFVTGNHEYYSGADAWIAHVESLGIRVLRNERVPIGDAFDLAGVDDASAHGMLPGHGADVPRALAGRDPSRAVVLLAHQPKTFKDALRADVDLQISGHIHGGQVVPFNWLVRLDTPYVKGLYTVGKSAIYVSTGTGYWGPPMRVGSRAEITRIELVSAAA
jgi:predicted MPP superfamily phosphohydrolase